MFYKYSVPFLRLLFWIISPFFFIIFIIFIYTSNLVINFIENDFSNKVKITEYFFKNIFNEVSFILENASYLLDNGDVYKKNIINTLLGIVNTRNNSIFNAFVFSDKDGFVDFVVAKHENSLIFNKKSIKDLFNFLPNRSISRMYFGEIVNDFSGLGIKILPIYLNSIKSNEYIGSVFAVVDVERSCKMLFDVTGFGLQYFIFDLKNDMVCSFSVSNTQYPIKKNNIKLINKITYLNLIDILIKNTNYAFNHYIDLFPSNLLILINRNLVKKIIENQLDNISFFSISVFVFLFFATFPQRFLFFMFSKNMIEFIYSIIDASKKAKIKKIFFIGFDEFVSAFIFVKRYTNRLKRNVENLKLDVKTLLKQKDKAYLIAEAALLGQEEVNAKIQEIETMNKIISARYLYVSNRLEDNKYKESNMLSLLADVNHELRTPLGSIIGFTDLILISGSVDESVTEYLGYIKNCSHYLLYLVSDIMDIIKIEEGVIALEESSVCLKDLIKSCISYLQNDINAKSIILNNYTNDYIPFLYADKYRIRQVILNIMANAIKYMGASGNTIDVYCYYKHKDGILLIIRDNGAGIPKEDMHRIFSKYTRGQSQQNVEGFGLGMSLIEKLVKIHNGQLIIESKPNIGTKATVIFPESRIIKNNENL